MENRTILSLSLRSPSLSKGITRKKSSCDSPNTGGIQWDTVISSASAAARIRRASSPSPSKIVHKTCYPTHTNGGSTTPLIEMPIKEVLVGPENVWGDIVATNTVTENIQSAEKPLVQVSLGESSDIKDSAVVVSASTTAEYNYASTEAAGKFAVQIPLHHALEPSLLPLGVATTAVVEHSLLQVPLEDITTISQVVLNGIENDTPTSAVDQYPPSVIIAETHPPIQPSQKLATKSSSIGFATVSNETSSPFVMASQRRAKRKISDLDGASPELPRKKARESECFIIFRDQSPASSSSSVDTPFSSPMRSSPPVGRAPRGLVSPMSRSPVSLSPLQDRSFRSPMSPSPLPDRSFRSPVFSSPPPGRFFESPISSSPLVNGTFRNLIRSSSVVDGALWSSGLSSPPVDGGLVSSPSLFSRTYRSPVSSSPLAGRGLARSTSPMSISPNQVLATSLSSPTCPISEDSKNKIINISVLGGHGSSKATSAKIIHNRLRLIRHFGNRTPIAKSKSLSFTSPVSSPAPKFSHPLRAQVADSDLINAQTEILTGPRVQYFLGGDNRLIDPTPTAPSVEDSDEINITTTNSTRSTPSNTARSRQDTHRQSRAMCSGVEGVSTVMTPKHRALPRGFTIQRISGPVNRGALMDFTHGPLSRLVVVPISPHRTREPNGHPDGPDHSSGGPDHSSGGPDHSSEEPARSSGGPARSSGGPQRTPLGERFDYGPHGSNISSSVRRLDRGPHGSNGSPPAGRFDHGPHGSSRQGRGSVAQGPRTRAPRTGHCMSTPSPSRSSRNAYNHHSATIGATRVARSTPVVRSARASPGPSTRVEIGMHDRSWGIFNLVG